MTAHNKRQYTLNLESIAVHEHLKFVMTTDTSSADGVCPSQALYASFNILAENQPVCRRTISEAL